MGKKFYISETLLFVAVVIGSLLEAKMPQCARVPYSKSIVCIKYNFIDLFSLISIYLFEIYLFT